MSPAAPMRVGLNLLWLVPGVVGGTEYSTVGQLRALAELAPADLDLVLFALPSLRHAHPDLAERFALVEAPVDGRHKALRILVETSWLPLQAARHRRELMHHAGGVLPPLRAAPAVVTIHDLQPLALPENFTSVKRRYLAAVLPRTAAARLVIVPSEHTRRDVVERLGIAPEKVRVVNHGVDPSEHARPSETRCRALLRALRITGPYFVYPDITYPHKQHAKLVAAFAEVHRRYPDTTLVLTGGSGPSEADLAVEVERLGVGAAVRRTGWIPGDDLEALLAGATALTFPSRYEGFGLPALEAMNAGCPVIASDATALPEVVGDAGLLVGDDDVEEWSRSMLTLLEDPAKRAELAARGAGRVAELSLARSAQGLLDVYRAALGRCGWRADP